jgi:ATP-dependent protease Clp ATPase subunit
MDEIGEVKCSFCGRFSTEVERILAGPNVAICDDCVALSVNVVGKGRTGWCKSVISSLENMVKTNSEI